MGKTTFFDLLCRFLKSEKTLIKINQKETFKNFKTINLKNYISLVTQKPLMLNDTVIKNISLQSEENVNSKKIEFVSEMCDLSFVENLSEKWNTVIGEKIHNLAAVKFKE